MERGVSRLWSSINHVALVVSDVGRSLSFYTDIIGMKQVLRPNFDRHGAWLTFGNVDLHLIKGRPAVHPDDDLIVSHIAITVSDMEELRLRLKTLKVASRKNVSVPNPADDDTGKVDQVCRFPIFNGFFSDFFGSRLSYVIRMATTLNFAIVKNWKNSSTTRWPKVPSSGI